MKLVLLSVGKLKRGPETELCDDYLTRLGPLARKVGLSAIKVQEFSESQSATAPLRQQEEAAVLQAALPPKAMRILLDERGKNLSSEAFSQLLRKEIDQGAGDIALLIGGPDGHDAALRQSAAHVICFGAMTWPHRLVRIMLLEQIYRAVTIMLNHPYHRA